MEEQKSFRYFLNKRNSMLVVSFIGDMNMQGLAELEACRQEILNNTEITSVVLFFQEVESISSDAVSVLAQLQREIRARPANLRLCAMKENIRERLVKMGVVRGMEVAEDLKAALLSFGKTA